MARSHSQDSERRQDREQPARPRSWSRRLLSFLTVYFACALLFQLGGATPSWGPESSLEAFSAGLFGMLALMTLLLARRRGGRHRLFWMASFLALSALGVDELFELHESGGQALTTDLLKVLLWLGAAGALACVHWLERPARPAQVAMLAGYAMHTLYLAAEVGDGGYFQQALLSASGLETLEGVSEVLMLSAYLFAFGAMANEPSDAGAALAMEQPPAGPRAAA